MKTVRFTKVVTESGKPESYTLWSAPEKDRHFQAALKAHRVMMVRQGKVGGPTDFGEVGFSKSDKANLLIFPKSLKPFAGHRVVGIKYDLLETDQPAEPPQKAKTTKPPKATQQNSSPAPVKKFEPLRVFRPEEDKQPSKVEERATRAEAKDRPGEARGLKALTHEVRKALRELEKGNAVAAYRILTKSISAE